MKRKIAVLLIALTTVFFSSCSIVDINNKETSNAYIDNVLEIIQNKDEKALREMFSKNAIESAENFDKSVPLLFDYFQGDIISYNDWAGPSVIKEKENGYIKEEMNYTCDIKTTQQTYRIAIQDFTIDTTNPNNVGIWSFYIIKMEDDTDPQFAYRGDDKNTPGININKKNAISDNYY